MAKSASILTALAMSLGVLAGCSSRRPAVEEQPVAVDLREISDMLHSAAGDSHRAPASLADLDAHRRMFPRGYDAVKSGSIVVLWKARLQDEGELGKDEAVVAYEKDAPTNGGYVLFSAGTVKKMTASEFTSARKADAK